MVLPSLIYGEYLYQSQQYIGSRLEGGKHNGNYHIRAIYDESQYSQAMKPANYYAIVVDRCDRTTAKNTSQSVHRLKHRAKRH